MPPQQAQKRLSVSGIHGDSWGGLVGTGCQEQPDQSQVLPSLSAATVTDRTQTQYEALMPPDCSRLTVQPTVMGDSLLDMLSTDSTSGRMGRGIFNADGTFTSPSKTTNMAVVSIHTSVVLMGLYFTVEMEMFL